MDTLSPEILLAVVTAGIGFYALLPEQRRLRFHLRMQRLDWFVLGASLLVVHYILFYPVLDRLGWTLPLGQWRWGFTPALASYGILGGAVVFVAARTARARLSPNRLDEFGRLLDELSYEDRYSDLFFILEGSLPQLRKAYAASYLPARLKRKWAPSVGDLYFQSLEQGEPASEPPAILRKVARFLPAYGDVQDKAREIVRRLLLSERFAERVAKKKPYFGLTLLDETFYEREEFQHLWFQALLDDSHSVLYFEVNNNQNMNGLHRYYIRPENRIIDFFFSDCQVAERLAAYRSFGNYAQNDLDRRWMDATDRYNAPTQGFVDEEVNKSAFYVCLKLFDIMIAEAIYQGITWHMWLYYLPSFAKAILRNSAPSPEVDLTREWPTPYHYFLYEIVSSLCHWVAAVVDLPDDQENARLDAVDVGHDNGNIPKSAALALGSIIGAVLEDEHLTWQFKNYLFEIPLRKARDLLGSGSRGAYGELLLLSLARSGPLGKTDPAFLRLADRAFHAADHMLRFELENHWKPLVGGGNA